MVLICEQLSCLPLEKGHYINDPNTNQFSPSLNHQKLVSNLNWKLWQSSLCFKRLYPIKISPHALEIFQTTKEDLKEICQNSSCRGIWVVELGAVCLFLYTVPYFQKFPQWKQNNSETRKKHFKMYLDRGGGGRGKNKQCARRKERGRVLRCA